MAKSEPNSAVLIEQLRAVIDNPDSFAGDRREILGLARKAAALLESPFETLQRLAYSVGTSLEPRHNRCRVLTDYSQSR